MTVVLEDDVPMPDNVRTRAGKYPFRTMAVGQSFLLNGIKNPRAVAAQARANHKPKTFRTAETDQGWRIWRTS